MTVLTQMVFFGLGIVVGWYMRIMYVKLRKIKEIKITKG